MVCDNNTHQPSALQTAKLYESALNGHTAEFHRSTTPHVRLDMTLSVTSILGGYVFTLYSYVCCPVNLDQSVRFCRSSLLEKSLVLCLKFRLLYCKLRGCKVSDCPLGSCVALRERDPEHQNKWVSL